MPDPAPPFALPGRTALVTGSSSGIGWAVAHALARAGARVALHGLETEEALAALARTLPAQAATVPVFSLDLAQAGNAEALAGRAIAALGRVDILVLAAAVQYRRPWTAITPEEFTRQIDVNLRATLVLLQRLVPPMQEGGWGRVVTIGSVQQAKPHPEMLVYAGTKAAQLSWVRNLAVQVGKDGVTVNNLAPGIIDTPRNADILPDAAARVRVSAPVPVRRVGVPEDCAGAALLLCSDAGAYVNGADIVVDGGLGVA
jgi:NAD(P)-dependent dehydrogenase (short-subunit alcohol dehydrogenase family)